MLDVDKIRQLVDMMVEKDLVEVSLRDGEEEINLRRPGGSFITQPMPSQGMIMPASALPAPQDAPAPAEPADTGAAEEEEEQELVTITSPMVGTFYAAGDPNTPPFVSIGTKIGPGTLVCIVEAMKVFNEIKSEVSGIIERILVKNEQAVEYGQPLFALKPV